MFRRFRCLLLAFGLPSAMAAQIAVPPARYVGSPASTAESASSLMTPDAAPRHTIALVAPAATESASKGRARAPMNRNPNGSRARPIEIGFARAVPDVQRSIDLARLPWRAVAGGGKSARVEIRSPGAAAVRLALEVSGKRAGITFRFAGSNRQQTFGPIPASSITPSTLYWSPILEGETGTLEIHASAGVDPSELRLQVPQISHLFAAGAAMLKLQPVDDIGAAAACEVDLACTAPSQPLLDQARAVAKLLFTRDGNTYLCTGTMLNDTVGSFTPYLFTASQCIDSQQVASTINTYWFFDAVACGSKQVPPYALVAGGAMLLARSVDYDWALVRLNGQPAPGTNFSAWRSDPVAVGAPMSVLHHPQGDLKKLSQGTSAGYAAFSDGSSYLAAAYSSGTTEDGSTGAAFTTLSDSGTYYEVRGGLYGGDASCTTPAGNDYYSRLDLAMPLLAQYLAPGTPNPAGTTPVVEYYFAGLNDYFITANAAEIQALDNGARPGWVRTGLTFLVYSDPGVAPPGVQPVCRFYVLPQYGDSHFYSADEAECAATALKFAGIWAEETTALFYIQLPDRTTGACPANTRPVYRFVNQTNQIHHRFTAEVDVRDCLISDTPDPNGVDPACREPAGPWLQEGYGTPPFAAVMCSPTS